VDKAVSELYLRRELAESGVPWP